MQQTLFHGERLKVQGGHPECARDLTVEPSGRLAVGKRQPIGHIYPAVWRCGVRGEHGILMSWTMGHALSFRPTDQFANSLQRSDGCVHCDRSWCCFSWQATYTCWSWVFHGVPADSFQVAVCRGLPTWPPQSRCGVTVVSLPPLRLSLSHHRGITTGIAVAGRRRDES